MWGIFVFTFQILNGGKTRTGAVKSQRKRTRAMRNRGKNAWRCKMRRVFYYAHLCRLRGSVRRLCQGEVTRCSLGPGVEARLHVDCAACGAPPALRSNAEGRALSSVLSGAPPVALTTDGRAGRVLRVPAARRGQLAAWRLPQRCARRLRRRSRRRERNLAHLAASGRGHGVWCELRAQWICCRIERRWRCCITVGDFFLGDVIVLMNAPYALLSVANRR